MWTSTVLTLLTLRGVRLGVPSVCRYKLAQQDVKHMLLLPREEVGESNLTVSSDPNHVPGPTPASPRPWVLMQSACDHSVCVQCSLHSLFSLCAVTSPSSL